MRVDCVDYDRIEKAIRFIQEHAADQPSLDAVAEHVGLSPCHFQRLFKRWAGVSPKRFLQYLTVERAKELLRASSPVLDAAHEVGLSGPGRLHDLFVSVEAVTPGEFKAFGEGLEIRYGFHSSPFGLCLAALTRRGLCALRFVEEGARGPAVAELRKDWKGAELLEDPESTGAVVERIFSRAGTCAQRPLRLLLRGTNFQLRVWEALLRIPEGALVSYRALAGAVGRPKATRAVANAVGANPVAYLIPCHRVLRSSGELGGYRWGTARKGAILGRELAACEKAVE